MDKLFLTDWCYRMTGRVTISDSGEKEIPLLMTKDMLKTFFTRLKLQISEHEKSALATQDETGVSIHTFEELVDSLRRVLNGEIEGVKTSYHRSRELYKTNGSMELDRELNAARKVQLLLNDSAKLTIPRS